jgi:Kef-type K+ transport system membrane component KefB/Trk K+ transport system NAD-binding subunit
MLPETAFGEIAAILLVATIIGALGTWFRQPLIVSLILVGLVVGPAGIALVTAHEQIELLASVGIALLLFVVGLRLDVEMVRTVGPVAVATGLGQVLFTSVAGFAIAYAFGIGMVPSLYLALALTFSSTIIVVKLLSDKREIDSLHGRIAVGLLIVQDLCVVLVMILLTSFGGGAPGEGNGRSGVQVALSGLAFLGATLAAMRWVLPALTRALARSVELLVLFGISWAVVLAAVSESLGLSREVGAFLAGIALASTPYRDAIGARLTTVRDFLLLFFFIDLGARIDLSQLGASLLPAVVLSAFVLVGKPLIMMVIMGVMGYRKRTAFLAGLTVAQISEFSLILGALGVTLGHIGSATMGLITTVGLVTITLSTYLIMYSGPLYRRFSAALGVFERRLPYRESGIDSPAQPSPADVIIFGLGRYGGGIARHLRMRNRRVGGVDFDPEALARWRAEGLPVFYGDAADPELFAHLPLTGVKWVVSTTPDLDTNRMLLKHLHDHDFGGKVAVACRTAADAAALEIEGADVLLRPFADAAEQAVDAITSGMDQLAAVASAAPGLREVRLGSGSVWAGRRLGEVPLRDEFGITVVSVSRSGRNIFNPGPDVQLFPADRLILSGEPDKLALAVDYLTRVEFADEAEQDFAVEELQMSMAPLWQERTLADLDLRNRFGVSVVAVRRRGDRMAAPHPREPLGADDRLVIAGRREDLDRLRAAAEGAAPVETTG